MSLPLTGIRIADLSWVLAGPIATSILASLGAEVIKIESRERPDQTRQSGPKALEDHLDRSRMFNTVNYSKKSLCLNMKHPEAPDIFCDLVANCDIVVENFASGALERMGLSLERIRQANPAVIIASSSGFGRSGPASGYVAYGNNLHAASGLTSLIHYDPDTPLGLLGVWSDPVAAYSLVFGVLGALVNRAQDGHGRRLDLSMLEASSAMLTTHIIEAQIEIEGGNEQGRGKYSYPNGCYLCSGEKDEWIAISVNSSQELERLRLVVDQSDASNGGQVLPDNENGNSHASFEKDLRFWCRSHSRDEVAAILTDLGIAHGESLTPKGLLDDTHLAARSFFNWRRHPLVGFKPVLRPPWLRSTGFDIRPAPLLGEHTDEVLRNVIGYGDEQIATMRREHPTLLY